MLEDSIRIKVGQELIEILSSLNAESRTNDEWAELESDDLFQSEHYVGGYDADEEAFCFSYYDVRRNEYWFQVTLEEVVNILHGSVKEIEVRPAD